MKVSRLLLIGFLTCITSQALYAQFTGGSNDGHSIARGCAVDLNGASVFSLSPVSGPSTFCSFASESYTVTVGGITQETTFTWSVPAGATIVSGQGTNTILVSFGSTNGNVSVDVANACQTLNATLPVSSTSCSFYAGGSNDGFSTARNCATNLNGGSVFTTSPVTGSSTFCNFATETYSIVVGGATSTTTYTWSVPPGATIASGQGTTTILVTFGNTNGNISVDVSNECETLNVSLPVSSTACQFYAGGVNDGFTTARNCATNLNGGSVFIADPITGPSTFCTFATESYTINVTGTTSTTTYVWSVPAGATITSGQGTNTILVTFGGSNGNVSVAVSNECETLNITLPVSSTSCTFYSGGVNDGSATLQQCATNLNGGSTFIPGAITGPSTFCAFASESYTINVAGALSNTIYNWSVPAGAIITSGQGTNTILVTFGGSNGNVSVAVSNECETINVSLPVSSTSCTFYSGGANDGFATLQQCATNLNGGSTFIPGAVTGPATFCAFASESYTINVAGALSNTVYNWSVPAGATIVSGQGTNTILVAFGNTSGNVSVNVSNECETINVPLAVAVTACQFYAGGSNDGFSTTRNCISGLNGGSAFIPGAIAGPTTFCASSTEAYSITVAGANSTTTYVWTVPIGATIVSGQGTSTILVQFASTGGNIGVTVANECETIPVSLAVSVTSCVFYTGGSNDGFSVTTTINIPLPVELVSFVAEEENGVVELMWITESELNNDFFIVEKSHNGREFRPLVKVTGAGTTNVRQTYTASDEYPYEGVTYYRLLQQDFDGTISYSQIISITVEASNKQMRVYPNPVIKRDELFLECYNQIDEIATITYVDSRGITLKTESRELVKGYNMLTLSPQFTSRGVYIVLIKNHAGVKPFRISAP